MQVIKYVLVSAFLLLGLSATPALAHMGNISSSQYKLMQQMMGSDTLNTQEELEIQMMGEANHERMEVLMAELIAGSLTTEEQTEFVQMMQNSQTAQGSQMMMNRLQMSAGMMNLGLDEGGFTGRSMMGDGFGAMVWVFWVTAVLIWIALLLAIFGCAKYLLARK
ncbi:MAG: hypothetical protein AAB558_04320 [Patescibacteria group bacterium]